MAAEAVKIMMITPRVHRPSSVATFGGGAKGRGVGRRLYLLLGGNDGNTLFAKTNSSDTIIFGKGMVVVDDGNGPAKCGARSRRAERDRDA